MRQQLGGWPVASAIWSYTANGRRSTVGIECSLGSARLHSALHDVPPAVYAAHFRLFAGGSATGPSTTIRPGDSRSQRY